MLLSQLLHLHCYAVGGAITAQLAQWVIQSKATPVSCAIF